MFNMWFIDILDGLIWCEYIQPWFNGEIVSLAINYYTGIKTIFYVGWIGNLAQ